MRLEYRLEPSWPVQAWLAECESNRVLVRHGRRVETRANWFCEAVWDGPFERGDFDQTDIVAGSGGRLREVAVTFVPAGSTLDRLQSMVMAPQDGTPARVLVSNSLACLVAAAGAKVKPSYRFYKRDLQSIIRGLKKYKKTLETSQGPVRLWYFHNVRWDGNGLTEVEKPGLGRDFSSFEKYHEFMTHSIRAVTANAADPARTHSLGLMGTMSSGYDSTTVATLAAPCGLRDVITFDQARGGDPDSGEVAAEHLGLNLHVVRRDGWRNETLEDDLPDVPFLTADGYGEDRFFLGARHHLRNRVLLTGYHGDKIWSKNPYKADSLDPHPEIKRGDASGLSHTEFRLSVGFINCPVPFWGCRQIHEVIRISRDPSMKPWDVPGEYSRPICRRICETAGIPRDAFGIAKRAGSINERMVSEPSRMDYRAWCARNGIEGEVIDKVIRKGAKVIPEPVRTKMFFMFYSTRMPTYRDHYFPWALERRAALYLRGAQAAVNQRAAVTQPRQPAESVEPGWDGPVAPPDRPAEDFMPAMV